MIFISTLNNYRCKANYQGFAPIFYISSCVIIYSFDLFFLKISIRSPETIGTAAANISDHAISAGFSGTVSITIDA